MKLPHSITILGACIVGISSATAAVSLTFTEENGNVLVTYNGSLDLTGISGNAQFASAAGINPSAPSVSLGVAPSSETDEYSGPFAAPLTAFGTGGSIAPTTTTGTIFGFAPEIPSGVGFTFPPTIDVPRGYANNDPISGQAIFNGQTFASMGLTPGTTTYALTSGDAISVTVVETVPEPSTALLGLLGAAALLRRKR